MMPQRRKGYTENEYGQPYDYFSSFAPATGNAGQEAADTATQQAVQAQQAKREERDASGNAMANLALSYFTGGATGLAANAATGAEGADATGRAMTAAAEGGATQPQLGAQDRSAAAAAAIGASSTGTDPKSIPSTGQPKQGTGENAPGMAEGYIPRDISAWDVDAQAEIKKRKADFEEKQRKYTNTGALIARAAFPFLNRVWDGELARDQQSLDSLQSDYRARYGAALQRGQLGETSRMNQARMTGDVKEIAGKVFAPRYNADGSFRGYESATPAEESAYIDKTRQATLDKSMADAAREAAGTRYQDALTKNISETLPAQFAQNIALDKQKLGIAQQEVGLRGRELGVREAGQKLNEEEFKWRSQYPPHGQSGMASPGKLLMEVDSKLRSYFGGAYEDLPPDRQKEWNAKKAEYLRTGGEASAEGQTPTGAIHKAPGTM